jgi:hypothetical protein
VNSGDHAFTGGPPVADAAVDLNPGSAALTGCTNAVVGAVTFTVGGSWRLGMTSLSATGGTGYVSGLSAHVYYTAGGLFCEFDVAGSLKGEYDNATGNLTLDVGYEGLVLSGVNQTGGWCDTLGFYDDDPAVFAGTINLSPAPVIS